MRRDITHELVSQLNGILKYPKTKETQTYLSRIVYNLIRQAATKGDEYDSEGKLTKDGLGDLQAILAIFDRLEGKPSQKVVGSDDGPVQIQYRTIEEVHMYLYEQHRLSLDGLLALWHPPLSN
jgi:hypothetical protein